MAIPLKLLAGRVRRFLASDALEVDAIKARSGGELHLGEPGKTVRVLGDLAVDGAGGGGGGGGGGSTVDSIFGRVGVVIASNGDYTFTHIDGCISDVQHAALPGGALHQCATASDAGFMAAGDKAKLDAVEAGAEVNTVTSVFGRSGDVLAEAGDYDFAQLTGGVSDTQHGALPGGGLHQAASPTNAGFMAASDKAKLDGVAAGAEVNTVTSVFGRVGEVLPQPGDYAFPDINGAINSAQHGALSGGALHQVASALDAGFMAASDKAKLDGVEAGAEVNTVTSVFGRSGDVAAQAGDYTAADVGAIASAEKGAALGVATLDGGGKVPAAQLPAVAIADAFPVASEAAMLALAADQGDLAIRSDLNKTFVLAAEPASTLANWLELLTPTDAVISVAGRTGAVVLSKADIADLSNVTNDAQLKRAAGDFASFPAKATPAGADVLLLEDSAAAGEKRHATVAQVLGAVASANLWLPDAAPLAPHPLDYEGGADISAFSEWDHGSLMTMSAGAGHMLLAHASDGTLKLSGAYKAAPASEYAFYVKVAIASRAVPHTRFGAFVAEDAADSTKRAEVVMCQTGGNPGFDWFQHSMNDYQTFAINRGRMDARGLTLYCRGRINGDSCCFDISDDGVSWMQMTADPIVLGYTPLHFGVCLDSESFGNVPVLKLRFLRVFVGAGSSGAHATNLGREVRFGV